MNATLKRNAAIGALVLAVVSGVELLLAVWMGWWFLVPIWVFVLVLVAVIVIRMPHVRVEIRPDEVLTVNQLRTHRIARGSVTSVEAGRSRLPTHRRTIFVNTSAVARVRLVATTIPRNASDELIVGYQQQLDRWHQGR